MNEEFEFFWNGPFSQWYSSPFTFNGIKFNRAEQFMMFCKAVFFNDFKTARAVMKSNDPGEQKKLGRGVEDFNIDKWATVARDIVYVGSFCKFTSDADLQKVLLDTNKKTLVEASPYDKIWGIGLSEGDPKTLNRNTWQGKNWLGEVLTKAKYDIINGNRNKDAFDLCLQLTERYKNK